MLYSTATFACFCVQKPPLDSAQYNSYEAIVIGKVIAVAEIDGWINHTVELLKVYKGKFTSTMIIVASPNDSCGRGLRKGNNYLVYGSVYASHPNQINTSACTRTICINCKNLSSPEAEDRRKAKIKADIDFLNATLN